MLHPATRTDPSLVPNVVQIAAAGQDPRKAALLEHDLEGRAIVERTIRRPGPPVRRSASSPVRQFASSPVRGWTETLSGGSCEWRTGGVAIFVRKKQQRQTRRGRVRLLRTFCLNFATVSVGAPAPCIGVETTFETRSRRGNEAERAAHIPQISCYVFWVASLKRISPCRPQSGKGPIVTEERIHGCARAIQAGCVFYWR